MLRICKNQHLPTWRWWTMSSTCFRAASNCGDVPQRFHKTWRSQESSIVRIGVAQILYTSCGFESSFVGGIEHHVSHRFEYILNLGNLNLVSLSTTQIHNGNARMKARLLRSQRHGTPDSTFLN